MMTSQYCEVSGKSRVKSANKLKKRRTVWLVLKSNLFSHIGEWSFVLINLCAFVHALCRVFRLCSWDKIT